MGTIEDITVLEDKFGLNHGVTITYRNSYGFLEILRTEFSMEAECTGDIEDFDSIVSVLNEGVEIQRISGHENGSDDESNFEQFLKDTFIGSEYKDYEIIKDIKKNSIQVIIKTDIKDISHYCYSDHEGFYFLREFDLTINGNKLYSTSL